MTALLEGSDIGHTQILMALMVHDDHCRARAARS